MSVSAPTVSDQPLPVASIRFNAPCIKDTTWRSRILLSPAPSLEQLVVTAFQDHPNISAGVERVMICCARQVDIWASQLLTRPTLRAAAGYSDQRKPKLQQHFHMMIRLAMLDTLAWVSFPRDYFVSAIEPHQSDSYMLDFHHHDLVRFHNSVVQWPTTLSQWSKAASEEVSDEPTPIASSSSSSLVTPNSSSNVAITVPNLTFNDCIFTFFLRADAASRLRSAECNISLCVLGIRAYCSVCGPHLISHYCY